MPRTRRVHPSELFPSRRGSVPLDAPLPSCRRLKRCAPSSRPSPDCRALLPPEVRCTRRRVVPTGAPRLPWASPPPGVSSRSRRPAASRRSPLTNFAWASHPAPVPQSLDRHRAGWSPWRPPPLLGFLHLVSLPADSKPRDPGSWFRLERQVTLLPLGVRCGPSPVPPKVRRDRMSVPHLASHDLQFLFIARKGMLQANFRTFCRFLMGVSTAA